MEGTNTRNRRRGEKVTRPEPNARLRAPVDLRAARFPPCDVPQPTETPPVRLPAIPSAGHQVAPPPGLRQAATSRHAAKARGHDTTRSFHVTPPAMPAHSRAAQAQRGYRRLRVANFRA